MKIIELRAENIKNLKVVEIRPDGSVVLEGRNGAGKSAILDAIQMGLTGKKIDQPIRNGEKRAEINIDMGTYKIKRVFTEKTDRLEVLSAEGAAFKSPQTLLNEIMGNLTFDPLKFANTDEKTQRSMLAALVGLDFSELNKAWQALYDERTMKNREIKGVDAGQYRKDPRAPLPLESLIGQMEVPEAATPRQEISMAEELKKVESLEQMRKEFEAYERHLGGIDAEMRVNNGLITDYKADIEALMTKIKGMEEENINLASEKAALKAPPEVTDQQIMGAKENLRNVEQKNIEIRKAIEYDKKQAELKAAKEEIWKIEEDMMKIELEKDRKVKEAIFPIQGLGLTDEFVTYNGKPFSQLSTGEQIRVSTAMAMALNPSLKIIMVREGSLLDQAGLNEILAMAKEKDYQLWIERVADQKEVGLYIEEGEIKE